MVGPFARSIGMTIANTNKYSWEHHRKGLVEGAVDGLYGLENQLRKKLSITLTILFYFLPYSQLDRPEIDLTILLSHPLQVGRPFLPLCHRARVF